MLDEGLVAGLQLLGLQGRVLCASERDAYAAATLLARMEDQSLEPFPLWAGNFEDAGWGRWHGLVDCLVAGFPCQPWSAAGKREGEGDERWLWPGIFRVIQETQPWLCFLENVPGLVSGGGLEPILADLASIGLDAEWIAIRAAAVGASHERERVFILAWRHDIGRPRSWLHARSRRSELGEAELGGAVGVVGDAGGWHGGEGRGGSGVENGASEGERRRDVGPVDPGADVGDPELRAGRTGGPREERGCPARGPAARSDGVAHPGRLRPLGLEPEPFPECAPTSRADAGELELAHPGRSRDYALEHESFPERGEAAGLGGDEFELAHPDGIGRRGQGDASSSPGEPDNGGAGVALASDPGLSLAESGALCGEGRREEGRATAEFRGALFAPGPQDPRWANIIADCPWLAPAVESGLCVLVDGQPMVLDQSRADQLRSSGNGVVALCAALAFVVLVERGMR